MNFSYCFWKINLYSIVFAAFCVNSFAQCTCTNGAAIGGMTPISGTTNIGVLQKNNLNANFYTTYGSGNDYYAGDVKIPDIDVKKMNYTFSSIVLGYGISNKFTVEIETGYFIDKTQDFGTDVFSGSGFSHFGATAKYNFLHSIARKLEFSAGITGKVPMQFEDEDLPQNIMPSNGDFGAGLILFFHKGFKKHNGRLVLINRSGVSSTNGVDYKYGNYYYTSAYYIQPLCTNFTALAEIRNEIRQKDKYEGNVFEDSGGYAFYFTPQINYSWRNWNFSLLGDIPMYRYYYGKQLSKQFSLALNINWEYSLEKSDDPEEEYDEENY